MNGEEGEERNCIGQEKCLIPTCIHFPLKQNPLTCVTKQYRCSWEIWSYTKSHYWSASVLKNSGSSAVVDNSTSGGSITAALTALIPSELKIRTTCALSIHTADVNHHTSLCSCYLLSDLKRWFTSFCVQSNERGICRQVCMCRYAHMPACINDAFLAGLLFFLTFELAYFDTTIHMESRMANLCKTW